MNTEATLPLQTPINITPPEDELEGGFDVGLLFRTLRRKWWLIAAITIATTGLAGSKVLVETPTYSGRFEMLVKKQTSETEVISNVPETLTSGESPSDNALDNDLIKILTSPKVLEPVVQNLKTNYANICPAIPGTEGVEIFYDPCYRFLAAQLKIKPITKNSNIIQASYQDPDPQTVQIVLNLISKAFLDYSLDSQQADVQRGIQFVEQKLPDLRAKVDTLQDQLQQLRIENDMIDPSNLGSQLSGEVSSFSGEKLNVEVQLRQIRSTYDALRQQLSQNQEQAASSALGDNPRYQSLLNRLLEIDTEIAQTSLLFLDTSPDMQLLKEEKSKILNLLAQQGEQSQREVVSQIQALEVREQALQDTLQKLNTHVDELSGVSRQYSDIQRELGIATENLSQFLAKREALQIDAAQREVPWEIITPPSEPLATPVNLPQNLAVGALLGLLLGTGTALLVDKSARVIHSDRQIQRTTRLPILGRIPAMQTVSTTESNVTTVEAVQHVGANIRAERNGSARRSSSDKNGNQSDEKSNTLSYSTDAFSEAFRSLYTNLRLVHAENTLRSLTVSSVMPGEGKSTTAIYLAEAAAAMGQRVLLVDTDLRNPQIHNYLEISNSKGLTNLFSGEANPAVIQKFSIEPNMYVISAGSISFEPTRLLSSRSMKKFTEQIQAKFDLVIYDTPPLLGQSDAYLVANYTDGLLLVTQPGKLKQPLLDRAMEQLRIADIKVLGLVTREN